MTWGPWLLLFAVAAILLECVVAAAWSIRLARRARALVLVLDRERGLLEGDVQRLRATLEETRRLWKPWQRALRWLRHPLVAAVMASLWRRVTA